MLPVGKVVVTVTVGFDFGFGCVDEGDDLLDYDEEEEVEKTNEEKVEVKQGSYVGIHSSGFKDFLLKPELMRAVVDCGFEHPSQVQVSSI